MSDNTALSNRLKSARSQIGLTQAELGKRLGHKDGAQVSRWEGGEYPRRSNIRRLANALEVTPEWLEFGIEAPALAETIDVPLIKRTMVQYEVRASQGATPEELASYEYLVAYGIERLLAADRNPHDAARLITAILLDRGDEQEDAQRKGNNGQT